MEVNRSKCCYCGGCVGVCPMDAIELKETVIVIDMERCTGCGICKKFCPTGAIRWENYEASYQTPTSMPEGILAQ